MNPPSAARALMNDLTKPLKHELPYIKKVHGGAWVRTIADERLRGISTNVFFSFFFILARSMDWRKYAQCGYLRRS